MPFGTFRLSVCSARDGRHPVVAQAGIVLFTLFLSFAVAVAVSRLVCGEYKSLFSVLVPLFLAASLWSYILHILCLCPAVFLASFVRGSFSVRSF